MKLAIIYNNKDRKLLSSAYSWTYRDMFLALIERFNDVQKVTESCSAKDIEADVIIIYDVHSSHHIEIDGLKDHPAVKYTYFNDPHQKDFEGFYKGDTPVKKLGAEARCRRAEDRGVQYIICPYRNGFEQYIKPHTEAELVWFPVAPRPRRIDRKPLKDRRREVLCNGHLWQGENGFRPYEFRTWAAQQKSVKYWPHVVSNKTSPQGNAYQTFLSMFAGATALCDTYVVPKYLEIPLSKCVCFAQRLPEYEEMGFKHGKNCIYVTKGNFNESIEMFKRDPNSYQSIADAGYETALNWTADKFADFIYAHAEKHNGK